MEREELLKRLEDLPPQLFIKIFRKLLTKQQYPYPDESILEDQYASALVLIADVPVEEIEKALSA